MKLLLPILGRVLFAVTIMYVTILMIGERDLVCSEMSEWHDVASVCDSGNCYVMRSQMCVAYRDATLVEQITLDLAFQ